MAGLLDYLEAAGETGATIGTGLLSGVVGAPYGLYKGITSGYYGTPQGVRIAEEEAKKFMQRNTYVPRGKVSQEALQKASSYFEQSKIPPVLLEAMAIGSIPRQAYLAQAERRGMELERAIAPAVERALNRGGLPAEMLEGMANKTVSQITRQGVGKSKNRVGTTGQYVGAPQGIDSPQKLAAMRANYMKDVVEGIPGRNWYEDSSKWIGEVAPANRQQAIADAIGVSSQGTGVDSNLGFAIKGVNQYAAGIPVETGRFPGNQSPLIQNALAGIQQHLGPKRQPFASNLSVDWNPAMAQYPVHDIWQGRAFGYKTPEGKPWDAGFSPQQHAFMDQQMVAIQNQLNKSNVGGFTDWNPLNTQAAAWTGAKIRSGDLASSEAAMHYGDFSPKYQAMATHEQAPGAGTGHLENLLSMPYEERLAFQNAVPWIDPRGRDMIYGSGGLLVEPSTKMVGAYTPKATGLLEVNPGEVARPLVQQSGGSLIPSDAQMLNIGESSRAFVDAQNAGAWHKIIPDTQTSVSERNSLHIPLGTSPTPEQMAKIDKIAKQNGMFAVDTGTGVNLINDVYSKIGKDRTGISLVKEIKGDLGSELKNVIGSTGQRVKIETGFQDYEGLWKEAGKGKATKQFLDTLNTNPYFAQNIEPALQQKAAANMQRDAEFAKRTGGKVREDIQRARQILATKGIAGLTAALASGVVLADSAREVLDPSQK